MPLINTLEHKFGRYAIPGLINIIAGLQVTVWILSQFQPDFLQSLMLNKAMVLRGEVWRLVTFIFLPGHSHPVWMIIAVMLLLTVGRTLEETWGAFRVNLYVLGGIVFAATGVLLQQQWSIDDLLRNSGGAQGLGSALIEQLRSAPDVGVMCSLWFSMGIFFAFACVAPNYELLLFFILPLKVKYIAMLGGAKLLLDFIDTEPLRVPMLFSFLNFFIACGPTFWRNFTQRAKVAARRSRFESTQAPSGSYFHKCAICSKTEIDDTTLEFRVTADGEEYCSICKPKQQA
ncbi:MAG: rhomboid family intramembrane serine protease [Verrucomicrobia bacterium]|nr:rhomboid family intramembrane serine protease [Verrucomicrobiota bacterium]